MRQRVAEQLSNGSGGLGAGGQQPVAQEQPASGQVRDAGAGEVTGADTGAGADAERARQLRVAEQLDGLPAQQSRVAYLRAAQRGLSDSEKDDMRWAGLPEVALDCLPAFPPTSLSPKSLV